MQEFVLTLKHIKKSGQCLLVKSDSVVMKRLKDEQSVFWVTEKSVSRISVSLYLYTHTHTHTHTLTAAVMDDRLTHKVIDYGFSDRSRL